ncbi:MAG: XdhC family protein [Candidatus Poseidonia sp.]|nr:XdhC family protein [Poseidonia sp.]
MKRPSSLILVNDKGYEGETKRSSMTARVLEWALGELKRGQRVVLASVLMTSGSVPGKTGARLAMSEDTSHWVGTVGGAGLEKRVLMRCQELLKQPNHSPIAEVVTYGLNKGAKGYEVTPLDSLCGGRVTVSLELMMPMPHVYIMGGGHCGQAIASAMDVLGWHYSVHDTRPEFASEELYPGAVARSSAELDDLFRAMDGASLEHYSDVLLLGHDWSEDQDRLLGLLHCATNAGLELDGQQGPRIGVIGSRSKWQSFQATCEQQGISRALLDQVRCPIGLNIGAASPEEIAVAVVAQIMADFKGINPDDPNWRTQS